MLVRVRRRKLSERPPGSGSTGHQGQYGRLPSSTKAGPRSRRSGPGRPMERVQLAGQLQFGMDWHALLAAESLDVDDRWTVEFEPSAKLSPHNLVRRIVASTGRDIRPAS